MGRMQTPQFAWKTGTTPRLPAAFLFVCAARIGRIIVVGVDHVITDLQGNEKKSEKEEEKDIVMMKINVDVAKYIDIKNHEVMK